MLASSLAMSDATETHMLTMNSADEEQSCLTRFPESEASDSEPYCWIQRRLAVLNSQSLENMIKQRKSFKLRMETMSPWNNQVLALHVGNEKHEFDFTSPGTWKELELVVNPKSDSAKEGIIATISNVHSPKSLGLSEDQRRLGVAVRGLQVEPLG